MARYLLDTNILLRAVNKTSSQHSAAVHGIGALAGQGHDLVVTPQVLVEFWAVATRPLQANGFEWPCKRVREEIDRTLQRFADPGDASRFRRVASACRYESSHWQEGARLRGLPPVQGREPIASDFNTSDFRRFAISVVSLMTFFRREIVPFRSGTLLHRYNVSPFRQKGPTAARVSRPAGRAGSSDRPAGSPLPRRRPNGHRTRWTDRAWCPAAWWPSSGRGVARRRSPAWSAAQRLLRQIRSNCRTRPRTRTICPARMIGVPMAHRS